MKIKRGSTSVRRLIFIGDSSSTTGAGLASLVYNSAGLVAYYFAGDLSNEVAITLATATLGTFTSGGFVTVDNTNMPGWYEIGIPDAALDAGNEVAIQLRGAANMAPVNIYIELDAFDYQTATQPVNVTQISGDAQSATDLKDFADAGYDPATNKVQGVVLVDTTTTNTDMRGTDGAMLAYTQPTGFLAATFPSDPADQSLIIDATNAILGRLPAALESGRIAAALSTARGTQIDNIENAAGYTLAVLSGACADPQTASETYAITVFGSTFTVDMAGQTSTGTRTAPTLTKT